MELEMQSSPVLTVCNFIKTLNHSQTQSFVLINTFQSLEFIKNIFNVSN